MIGSCCFQNGRISSLCNYLKSHFCDPYKLCVIYIKVQLKELSVISFSRNFLLQYLLIINESLHRILEKKIFSKFAKSILALGWWELFRHNSLTYIEGWQFWTFFSRLQKGKVNVKGAVCPSVHLSSLCCLLHAAFSFCQIPSKPWRNVNYHENLVKG